MHVQLLGTGGGGWPQPGCGCASCSRCRSAGRNRDRTRVLVDGVLCLEPGSAAEVPPGYQLRPAGAGWDLTGPDGGRLLIAAEPGTVPEPAPDAAPYDVALLDLLENPAQLGALRARGLVHPGTAVAPLHADHRIVSEAELTRRCGLWQTWVPDDGMTLTGPPPVTSVPHRALVLGGARSGKSGEAELRLAAEPEVIYLAAGHWPEPDPEWATRVAAHRGRRPALWRTVESTDVAGILRDARGAVLIDGIGSWLAAVLAESGAWDGSPAAEEKIAARVTELVTAWRQTQARVVAVSDEVGAGVVPEFRSGRLFRDQLGWLNQRLAAESEETVLVVAGKVVTLSR
jgi:adenosylcobinamide kinase / adenosylcobinamide-phosphate guanylyltransferase